MKAFVINLAKRPDRMDLFNQNKFPFKVERFDAIETDPGWVGCTQSHFTILQKNKRKPVLIMEDDVLFTEPWSAVKIAMKQLPMNWDALWLGGTLCGTLTPYSDNLFKLFGCLAAHAIIYNSQRMIDYIIQNHVSFFESHPGRKTIDVFYCDEVIRKFNCFITYPFVATQRAGFSDIEKSWQDYTGIINNTNINAGK
jgi:glycosyl transferase family 25